MKKSLFTLFTSLIVCGLLLVWSANAMTYTVNGNQTNIGFIKNETISEIRINWWDNSATNVTSCGEEYIQWIYYYLCTKEFNDGLDNHEITIKNNDNSDNYRNQTIYLVNANVSSINNFDYFLNLKTLRLNQNNITALNYNKLSAFNNITIYMDENSYNDYDNTSYSYFTNIDTYVLRKNNLTTIPKIIRKNRDSYQIILDSDHRFQPTKSNIIDLSDNPINFIWITEINDNTIINTGNWYSFPEYYCRNDCYKATFERFAYASGTNPSYTYQIKKDGYNITWDNVDSDKKEVSIDLSTLFPWSYNFEVCFTNWITYCDNIDFTIEYNEEINFTSDSTEWTINSLDDLVFKWQRSENLPSNLVWWYTYTIEKDNQIIISEDKDNLIPDQSTAILDEPQSKIETALRNYGITDPYGSYTLTVYLIDSNWDYATTDWHNSISASRTFILEQPPVPDTPTIQITRPSDNETEAITDFSWNSSIPEWNEFTNYTWNIKSGSTIVTGWTITNENEKRFEIDNLDNWEYTFYVELNYSRDWNPQPAVHDQNPHFNNGAKHFTVAKTYPSIKINRPLEDETGAVTYFSWTPNVTSWFSFNNYEWVISGNNTLLTGKIDNKGHTWFNLNNLSNWRYSFNIKMNYIQDSNNQPGTAIDSEFSSQWWAKTFTVDKPSSLKIISPITWAVLTQAENVFSRTWTTSNTFIKYTYSVIWNKYSYTWETTDQDYTWFSIRNLEDWAYTFTISMLTDAGTETDSRNFSVSATSWAYINITSPENWKTYTWNRIKLVPTDFTWVWTWSTRISKFTYKLTNTTTNSEITSWTINKNSNWNYSIQKISLPSGKYSFEVKMLDSNGTTIKDKTHNFTISIPSHLTISTPPAWQLNSKNVTFSRTWFAEFGDHYKYKLDRVNDQWNIISTITWNENTSITSFSMTNIHNGKYTFTVSIMNSSNSEIKTESRTFWIPDDQDLILDISDWTTSTKNIKTGTWIFSRWWKSEDFYWYYYSISGTNFKNEPFIHTWKTSWEVTWNIILTNLTSWKYRFSVNMLDENDSIITWKYLDFTVDIPASLKITNPSNWSTITSSSTTLSRMGKWDIFRTWYSTDSRHYEYELLQVTASWNEQKAASPKTNANSFSYSSFQDWASYQLTVKLYSGNTLLARDTSSFSVSIPKHSSGWWGWSSSKSHPTNDLSVSVTNDEPITNERVEVVVDINDKYTWKVDFTKMQYYSFDEEKRIDIPVTSKNYVSDYSDDAKLGYVKFDSSDRWEKNLSEFLMFSQPGNYRIHVEDKDWYKEYTEFYVWKWNKTQVTAKAPEEDEYYIARSCKKYKIEFLNNLGVYTSPNLKQDEYFVSKDYFKRYIDSKNKRANWCPTNIWWITTTYRDTSNSSDRYTAPNGKVYFINWKNWSYSSTELDKELNGSKKFWSVTDLKYFIRDRNPFISMAKLWPTTAK